MPGPGQEPLGYSEAKFLGWTEEDAAGWRQRFIAGIDQPVDGEAFVTWGDPKSITLELRNVSLEAVESLSGQPLIRLCDRRIPSEGTE